MEFRRGAKLPEQMLTRVVAPGRLFDIATVEQGMGKLLKGRSDPMWSRPWWPGRRWRPLMLATPESLP